MQEHLLLRIGIKGREVEQQRPAANLVFLLDVSGSMDSPNKLPLLKRAMRMLVQRLGEDDRVSIVVYAGAAGLVLPPTPATERTTIMDALERLHAGGSTNGGEGIQLAYAQALEHFLPGGVNRILLCSDGDFNVGVTSTGDLVRLAEQHAKAGIYLSVLGFGIGNHNDAMLEQLSNKANGNYAFIDTPAEAQKVLVQQLSGTLVTIAKDVKIQVEFNPAQVAAYRLIGYENRLLADRDFQDDTKDAGEIGAGHTVTALYELIPAGQQTEASPPPADDLKYQQPRELTAAGDDDELLTVNLRFKQPDEDQSTPLSAALQDAEKTFDAASKDFRFAAAVASFGMLLRGSQHAGEGSFARAHAMASAAMGQDVHGYRAEFLELVRKAAALNGEELVRQ
jgi:Ca-activated chloride channel family protein